VTTRIKVEMDVEMRGAWFRNRHDPVVREFNEKAKTLVTKHGQDEVQQRIRKQATRSKRSTGAFAKAVVVKDFAKGRTVIAEYPQVLYGPWLEGTSTRNESTRFKGYRAFKLTRGRLRKNVGDLVQDLFREAVAKLNAGGAP